MVVAILVPMDTAPSPWLIELIVTRNASRAATDRSSVARDVARGLLVSLRRGVAVERAAFLAMSPEDQHIVRMRALAEVSDGPVVFSHFSAAVVQSLPVQWERLRVLHTTVAARSGRGQEGVSGHLFTLADDETEAIGPLIVTRIGRTVVDLAGAGPLEEAAMAADAALRAGQARDDLLAAAAAAGPRRASTRIGQAIALGHPGAESAAESRARVTELRIGVEPPVLQFPLALADGRRIRVDQVFVRVRGGVEIDGKKKYFDPGMAPQGAEAKLWAEKRREDEMRSQLAGLIRPGWAEAVSAARLRPMLARIGIVPVGATLADYCAAASEATSRFVARSTVGQR